MQQPKGLYLLFFTELWERFGFYTIQTILILYMSHALHYSDDKANLMYAALNAMLYLTPAIGGYIADKYIGFQRAIIIGGILLTLGYGLASLPGERIFFFAMSLLIVANGFFKPNVSSIVGDLYTNNDPRREGGFTLFYMGINVGALIPPLIAGAIVLKYGWHAGFALAAAGMLLGLLTFIFGRKLLENCGKMPDNSIFKSKVLSKKIFANAILLAGTLFSVYLIGFVFKFPDQTDFLTQIAMLVMVVVLLYFTLKEPKENRNKMFVCVVLIIISVGFWAIYNQTFTSLMFFADRNMTKTFLGVSITPEMTQFFNPFFIIVLSPLLSQLWIKLSRYKLNPATPFKFAYSILFLTLGFLFLWAGTLLFSHQGQVSAGWLAGSYFLQTIGELLLSPIGLAMITVLVPKRLTGMMMGVWFFSQAEAFAMGGYLANIADVPKHLAAVDSLPVYSHAFFVYAMISAALTIISLSLAPFLRRLIKED